MTSNGQGLPSITGSAARVLLVMSDPTNRLAILDRLRMIGLEVESAGTGGLALDKLRRSQFDAVLLDLCLSEENSVDVIKDIRRDPDFSDLPIYGLAGSGALRLTRKATKAGAWRVFDLTSITMDEMVADVGASLLGGEALPAEVMEVGANEGDGSPLQASINRLGRHMEHLAASNQVELAQSYGELRGKVQLVVKLAMLEGRYDIVRLATHLGALLKLLSETPDHATASTVRTVSLAAEVLRLLSGSGTMVGGAPDRDLQATVIDDEMVSRSVVCSALRSIRLKFEVFSHTSSALRHVVETVTDLVVVNLAVEDASFAFSAHLRANADVARVPVLYVSGVSEFENAVPESLNSEDELITRPFIFVELAVRGLSLAMKSRFERRAAEPAVGSDSAEGAASVGNEPAASAGLNAAQIPHGMRSALSLRNEPGRGIERTQDLNVSDIGEEMNGEEQTMENLLPPGRGEGNGEPPANGGTALYSKNFEANLLNEVTGWLVKPEPANGEPITPDALGAALDAELLSGRREREQLISRMRESEAEMLRLQNDLLRERQQRLQLEQVVQQLMEDRAARTPPPAAPEKPKGKVPNGGLRVPFAEASAEIQEELKALTNLADELREELEVREVEKADLQAKIEGNEVEIRMLSEALASERAEREALNARISEAEQSRRVDEDRGDELARAMESAELAAAAAQRESGRREQLEKELKELAARLEKEQAQAVQFGREKSELEKRLQDLRSELAESGRSLDEAVARRDRLKEELEEKVSRLEASLVSAESENRKLAEAQLAGEEISAEAGKLHEEIERAHEQVAAHQQALAEAGEQKKGLEALTQRLQSELDACRAELDRQGSTLKTFDAQHESLAETNQALSSELALLQEQRRAHAGELAGMERRVKDTVGQLARAAAELEGERGERRRIEQRANGLSAQLRELRGELGVQLQMEKDQQERIGGMEQQLKERDQLLEQERHAHDCECTLRRQAEQKAANLAADLDAARAEVTDHLQSAKENQVRVSKLEQQLRAQEESLVRVTEHLEAERGERRRFEERARAAGQQVQESLSQLGRLQQAEKENLELIASFRQRAESHEAALEKLAVQLEKERHDRRHVEQRSSGVSAQLRELHDNLDELVEAEKGYQERITGLEQALRERQDALARLQSELDKEIADRELAEEQVQAAGDFSARLQQYQSAFEETRKSFEQSSAEMAARLRDCQDELAERDERLQQAAREEQRLEGALADIRREVRDQAQQSVVEIARLKSELQVVSMERQRLEGDAMNTRFVTLNHNRSSRALVNGLRRQLQEPVDALTTAARRLLEFELHPELKQAAESTLEKAIALQTRMRESDVFDLTPPADAPGSAGNVTSEEPGDGKNDGRGAVA